MCGSLAFAVAACSPSTGAVEPVGTAAIPDTAATEATPATAPSESTAELEPIDPGPPPTAKVVKVEEDAAHELHVSISFDNPGNRTCKILSYTLTWPGGSKRPSLENYSVKPHDTKQRSLQMHAADGDMKTLTPEQATVTLKVEC